MNGELVGLFGRVRRGGNHIAPADVGILVQHQGDVKLRDEETGSTWSGLSGKAIAGPLTGEFLQPLPSFYSFWFAWTDFFIEAELYEAPSSS